MQGVGAVLDAGSETGSAGFGNQDDFRSTSASKVWMGQNGGQIKRSSVGGECA